MTDAKVRTKLSADGGGPVSVDALRSAIQRGANIRIKLSAALPSAREALFVAIEAERRTLQIKRTALALSAGVSVQHYERLCRKAGVGVTARFVTALLRGLRSARAGLTHKQPVSLDLARAAYVGCLQAASKVHGQSFDLVQAQLDRKGEYPGDSAWRAASTVRASALYLASVEIGMASALLSTLTGITPAAISYALNRVEDRRDEAAFDAALDDAARLLKVPA